MNTNNIVMWVILPNNAGWDCFKTPILREILRIRSPLLEEHCAFFGSQTFVPISWMCKKQTSVSHSSTESDHRANTAWEERLTWFKSSPEYRNLDTIDGEPIEFEWNIFAGFTTLQLVREVQEFLSKMSDPSEFKGRVIFMSMFNDISW